MSRSPLTLVGDPGELAAAIEADCERYRLSPYGLADRLVAHLEAQDPPAPAWLVTALKARVMEMADWLSADQALHRASAADLLDTGPPTPSELDALAARVAARLTRPPRVEVLGVDRQPGQATVSIALYPDTLEDPRD